MKLKIFCRCSSFPSWSGEGLTSTPVQIFTTVLPHVSAYLTPSSGRPYVFLVKNHCFYKALVRYIGCVTKYRMCNIVGLSVFTVIEIVFVACYSVNVCC